MEDLPISLPDTLSFQINKKLLQDKAENKLLLQESIWDRASQGCLGPGALWEGAGLAPYGKIPASC